MELNVESVVAPEGRPTRVVAFLHGILGSGGNLRSHARRFVQAKPDCEALLFDLRGHGSSLGIEGPDTVENAARDVVQTIRARGRRPLNAVVGHSFGGKVALLLARMLPTLEHVVTLDSSPGARVDARGSEATLTVLRLLETLKGPWQTREAFTKAVEDRGQSKPIAQWLAMNLHSQPGGLMFKLDLARIRSLMDDYLQVDLWPVVEAAPRTREGARIHLVIGTRSTVYLPEDLQRAEALASSAHDRVTLDHVEAGHWVHVDDPQRVADVLQQRIS